MDIKGFYQKRIEKFLISENNCKKKERKFPVIRLLIVSIGLVTFYNLFFVNVYFAFAALGLFILVFGIILKFDLENSSKKQFYNTLKKINEQELKCIEGEYNFFDNGIEYYNKNHSYSSDLDIFGNFSIFQYINRTTLKISRDILAEWLTTIAKIEEIELRQEAINELKNKIDWRQKLYATGIINKISSESNPIKIFEWLKEPFVIINNKIIVVICTILPIITVLSVIFSFFFIPVIIPILLILSQLLIINSKKKQIKIIHDSVSRNVELLKTYSNIISTIENEKFISKKLNYLIDNFKINKRSASDSIKYLSNIADKLDYKFNILISPILNGLFIWNIHQIIRLEKWKKKNGKNVEKWFFSVGEFEVLASLSNLSFNNPKWIFPEISKNNFIFKAINVGHPLIKEDLRVCNNIEISELSKMIIVTGSNMSGKSTFLRTIGVNIVLAMTGSCVCAEGFIVSSLKIYSSMRTVDSLEENTSFFYAELKRLEKIIRVTEKRENVFLLLDELLKGTNSNDKQIGSIALIKQLIKNNAVGIIATHDTGLSNLISSMPDNIENFNFDVQVENDELFFDYKLHKGVCKSLNASILMKKMGIII